MAAAHNVCFLFCRADATVNVWEWSTGKHIATGRLAQRTYSVAMAPNGQQFVTCGAGHVKYWSLKAAIDTFQTAQKVPPAILPSSLITS